MFKVIFIIALYVIGTDQKNPLSTNRRLVKLWFIPIMEYYVLSKEMRGLSVEGYKQISQICYEVKK